MSTIARTTVDLIDHLQERGYDPSEDIHDGDWYDLTASGAGTVRLALYPNDGYRAEVHFFDAHMVAEWSVCLSPGTPDAVIIANLEVAEMQLRAEQEGVPLAEIMARPAEGRRPAQTETA